MKINKIIILIVFIITIFCSGWYFYKKEKDKQLQYVLKKEGLLLDISKDFIVEKKETTDVFEKEKNILAKNKNETIKVKIIYNIDNDKAGQYVEDQKIILSSLYEPVPPPYPEFIGQEVSCDEKYKPILKTNELGVYYLLYAGERFGYGVCEGEAIKYKALLGYFYLKDRLLKIEYFSPNKSFEEIESIIDNIEVAEKKKIYTNNKIRAIEDNGIKNNEEPVKSSSFYNTDLSCPDCNLIVVSLTGLRKDHLGIYGYNRETSPNIDKFFKNAIIFNEAFVPSPWTLPNIASFFTSLFPYSHKAMKKNIDVLDDKFLMLAEILESNGYGTAAFTGNEEYNIKNNFDQGFEKYIDQDSYMDYAIEYNPGKYNIGLKELLPYSISWLKNTDKKQKKFLFLQGFDVHCPYVPNPEFMKKFSEDYNGKIDFSNCIWSYDKINPITKNNQKYWPLNTPYKNSDEEYLMLAEDDVRQMISLYDSEIYETDYYLKDFFDEIKQMGMLENTIILFMSEHGEYFGEHDRFMRAGYQLETFYDEALNIPLMIYHPKIKETIRVENLVQIVDIMPTILDVLQIEDPQKEIRQGKSFLPSVLNSEDINDFVYAGSDFYNNVHEMGSSTIQVVRSKDWKYMKELYKKDNEPEFKENKYLFNLKEDPKELNNLYNSNNDIVNFFEEKIEGWVIKVKK